MIHQRARWVNLTDAGVDKICLLEFGLVPGLCARLDHWYDARVEAKGSRLRAWINDILVADVAVY